MAVSKSDFKIHILSIIPWHLNSKDIIIKLNSYINLKVFSYIIAFQRKKSSGITVLSIFLQQTFDSGSILGLSQPIRLRPFGAGLYTTHVSEEMPAWQGEDGSYLQAHKWNDSYGVSCLDCNPQKFRKVLGTFTNIWSSHFTAYIFFSYSATQRYFQWDSIKNP